MHSLWVFSPAVEISTDGSARGLGEEEEQDSPAVARPLRSTASSPGPSGQRRGVRPAAGGGGARSRGWRRVRCPQSRDAPAAAGERPATSGDRKRGGGGPARLGDDDGGRWRRGAGEDPRSPGVVAARVGDPRDAPSGGRSLAGIGIGFFGFCLAV